MSKYQYDVTVIGGGSGGLVAARVTAALGARTCLIDKKELGGDCLHYGCVPSKSLIHAAKIVKTAKEAALLGEGLEGHNFKVDMAKVTQRIKGIIERVGETEEVYIKDVTVKFGQAEFKSPHELILNGEVLTSQSFIIATGSSPQRAKNIVGLEEIGYLTNEGVFDLLHLPGAVAIIGGGPIGVELSQAFARLGSQVTILQGSTRILPKEEPEVSQEVAKALERDGVRIMTSTRPEKAWRNEAGQKVLEAKQGGQSVQIAVDEIIVALGRTPNVNNLKLEAAGIKFEAKGIEVNDYLQTTADNIYAVGDVLGGYLFTHVAAYQAGIAARNVILPIAKKKADYTVLPWVTFSDPEASRVGLTEEEAITKHGKIKVIRFDWKDIDRAQTQGETEGFIKLILNEKGEEILGAHLVGAGSGEMLAEITLAMQHKLGISGIIATIHAYPTIATGLQTAAFEAYLDSMALASSKRILKPLLNLRG